MRLKFWGTRGSIAAPGAETVRYGGNTSCYEVQLRDNTVLVVDAGTGIRALGLELIKSGPLEVHVLITHTHWDHIQGLPFFVPLFVPGCEVTFYGTFDPVYRRSLADILKAQMEYCYFPVREAELKAKVKYRTLRDGEQIKIGGALVRAVLMNHPVLTFGYHIEADGQRLFFCGDHEPPSNIYEPGNPDHDDYEQILMLKRESIERWIHDVDVLVGDATYTESEYPGKVGWGHGTHLSCLNLARRIGARQVVMTHHEPMRTDEDLDALVLDFERLRQEDDPTIQFAREGEVLSLDGEDDGVSNEEASPIDNAPPDTGQDEGRG